MHILYHWRQATAVCWHRQGAPVGDYCRHKTSVLLTAAGGHCSGGGGWGRSYCMLLLCLWWCLENWRRILRGGWIGEGIKCWLELKDQAWEGLAVISVRKGKDGRANKCTGWNAAQAPAMSPMIFSGSLRIARRLYAILLSDCGCINL